MSSPINDDIYGMIKEIIQDETIFMRHYIGKVVENEDILKKGRVKITIPELGMDTPDLALWCNARQGNGISIPAIGSYAEIYFINGEREKPVYLFPASEIIENIPKNYTGIVTEHVLFEDPENKDQVIKYDSATKLLQLFSDPDNIKIDGQNGTVMILNGTESYVLGDAFLTWLNNFITTVFNAHTHLYNPGPGGPIPTAAPLPVGVQPTNILSTVIKGK